MLLEELEKMKAELAKEEVEEEVTEEEKPEEKEEEVVEAAPVVEEKKEEEPKKEELDDTGYARLRREAAAEKRRADQLARELEEARKPRIEEDVVEAPPLPPEFQAVIESHRMGQAQREFEILENKAKQLHPEYGAVATEYAAALYQSIRLQNPRLSELELNERTKTAILRKAGEYANAGYENPVEEMYHEARELGFTGKSLKKEEAEVKEEKLEPDLKKVSENRKRSTGMTANNGRSEGMMTLRAAATDLTAAEWAKLPKADKQRIMYGQ